MKAATIYDVAREAGVSHQTVTRYLQGFEGMRPATRERVAAALRTLDYRPNSAARLLRSQHTNRIGVLADRIDESGPSRILRGASQLAHERGYVLDIVVADGTSPAAVEASLAVLTEHQVAGILATAQTQIVYEELRRHSFSGPMVLGSQFGVSDEGPSLSELAGRLAADHLLDLGHRHIGYVAGSQMWLASAGRLEGFRRRVEERGGQLAWVREGDWSAASAYRVWEELSSAERRITAVGAANDSMAMGLISAAHASGLSVPNDLSVMGNDDIPEAAYYLPALSTLAMDFEAEGRVVLDALIREIEGRNQTAKPSLASPRIVARKSTARLR
ncbi:LacI family DNA-binding transcriptional regulator [Paenarthrobacter sp. AB444]|uniref:LacI family DNA-binding transcriptional regulator n=1 Tax=Paenarthrobacter sp. AB444 TaxID=3025681 RepID=UPI0023651BFE|nr:LacI family DNA-binding transcriptional regulator [Paenarthrobacter sp. AB444]MDD7833898.1 LacI family DNA-binding transcriptional regulator [Paenarthrobacter sp. AB444]